MNARQTARIHSKEWEAATRAAYAKMDVFEQDAIDDAAARVCRRIPNVGPITAREILAAIGMWLNEEAQ